MKARIIIPFLAILLLGLGGEPAPSPSCEAPIRWRIADVDDRFGIDVEAVTDAARQAAMLWGDAIGNPILFQAADDGFPIRLVFDERQQKMLERERRRREIESAASRIREAEANLLQRRADLEERRRVHQERSDDLRARLDSHRSTVEHWYREGVAPSGVLARLQEEGEALDAERASLNEEALALNELVEQVNSETRQLNQDIADINEARQTLQADFPLVAIRSGHYQESRRTLGPVTLAVDREIEVYRFSSWNNLVLVIAHELGHALGLDHSEVPGAVMSDTYVTEPGASIPQLHSSDIEAVRERCS